MVLFFIVRAMHDLAVDVLLPRSVSIFGACVQALVAQESCVLCYGGHGAFGVLAGVTQGGGLQAHLRWIFASNTMLSALCCVVAVSTISPLCPVADMVGEEAPII